MGLEIMSNPGLKRKASDIEDEMEKKTPTTEASRKYLKDRTHLFKSGEYSDFIIRCEGRDFHVHKSIVCVASEVMASQFKYSTVEAHTNVVEHNEFDADTIERMLWFIYTNEYSVPPQESPAQQLVCHARVCFAADYYGLGDLAKHATSAFESSGQGIDVNTNPVSFFNVVSEVYHRTTSPKSDLRQFLVRWAIVQVMLHGPNSPIWQETNSRMTEPQIQEFCQDLFKRTAEKTQMYWQMVYRGD